MKHLPFWLLGLAAIVMAGLIIFNVLSWPTVPAPQVAEQPTSETPLPPLPPSPESQPAPQAFSRVDFASLSPTFRFSANLPASWVIEQVAETDALNIYDPSLAAANNLEKSQIFIRNFTASQFLTLNTVNVLRREETDVKEHAAVRYEIEKKPETPAFTGQPSWRGQRHELIDIRLTHRSPSVFYVIARNPSLPEEKFEQFIASLIFHNDKVSFTEPLPQSNARVTKKKFGQYITPANSPVQPERFSGYHTGADYEISEGEQDVDVPFRAICGGKILDKKIAAGYGGVLVQECLNFDEAIVVVHGHVSLASIKKIVGDYLSPGEVVGNLGEPPQETDGERKHLHLGVHIGSAIDLRGYVQSQADLKAWLNPLTVIQ